MEFNLAPDVQKRLKYIIKKLGLNHIKAKQVVAFRSHGSKAKAYARIWSFPTIWQKALEIKPHYCIEVISAKFDKLNTEMQTKTLIHELLHIPKTFSGALLPHRGRGKIKIDRRTVEKYFKKFKQNSEI